MKSKQHHLSRIFLLAMVMSLALIQAQAAVPNLINYQGKLLDTSNNPRNGAYDLTFSIWDAASGGTQVWTEDQLDIPVSNGVFSVQLGAATALPASAFSSDTRYLQIVIEGETATSRQRLVTSPYAYRAAVADDVATGDGDYIQNRGTLQTGSTFYVSSGTVNESLRVGGVLTTGSGNHQITDAAGLVQANKLTGVLPSAQLSGTYASQVVLSSNTNSFTGNGAGLTNVTAAGLLPGDTDYIQNTNALQTGATFYVSSGTVFGSFSARGATSLGGTAGVADVTIQSNLIVSGAGPHVFTGDVRVNGNDLLDSGGTSRLSLGSTNRVNGDLSVPGGAIGLTFSTSVVFVGATNGDNYIAYPFTAGGTIAAKDVVIISGANTVSTTTTAAEPDVIGIAVSGATAGNTVYVAMSGIVTNVIAAGAVTTSNAVCTSGTAGRVDDACNANFAPIGKALTGASVNGDTITVVLFQGR